MAEKNAAVAIYDTHLEAEDAVKALHASGFDMKLLSIIGKDYHSEQQVTGFYNTGDRMMYWGTRGAFWGYLFGVLFGSGLFLIPGFGPLVVGGPLVAWIVAGFEGAVLYGGLSALGAGLYSIGIPKDSILAYETALKADKFMLIAHGTAADVARAKEILGKTGATTLAMHASAA